MPPYSFRIRFVLPAHTAFDSDESSLDIPIPDSNQTYLLKAWLQEPIKKSSSLVLTGGGFTTEEEALEAGRKAKDALSWAAGQTRLGINVGKDTAPSHLSDYVRNLLYTERGVRGLDDVHGLMVYEEGTPTRFFHMSASGVGLRDISPFIEAFQTASSRAVQLTDQGRLALELYGLSHFEASAQARFLTLVMALEVLAQRKEHDSPVVEHIEMLKQLTQESLLGSSVIDSLVGSIDKLKRESIGSTGRQLVGQYLVGKRYSDQPAKRFFTECYDLRSEIMHKGKIPKDTDAFSSRTHQLALLVEDLFQAGAGQTKGLGMAGSSPSA